jgi:N-methylhydantoinase A/oxoprolinase/acetone carboxylase beta subunit
VPDYYVGIDTGGTFTDGVLLDPARQCVVKTAKVLTSHHDLKICIAQVLDCLLPPDPAAVRLVSLSTTLATNAIVEGKSRPVGLLLLGYDRDLVYQYGFQRQFGTEHFEFITGGLDVQAREKALDEPDLLAQVQALLGEVEAFAVTSYAGTRNAGYETRAAELIASLTNLPVVLGHHLSSGLDSILRATTSSLNASLLSTAYDFMTTVQAMLNERAVHCPLIVVRGDGSLVSAEFAARRPVEIIHSGPATSAIGGLYLAGLDSALVVDVGGTTTDLALLHNGGPILEGAESTVGGYRTSVRTIRARSFGLGGDSQINFDPRGTVTVGPGRVIPLSYLASVYPEVRADLLAWLDSAPAVFYSDKLEYWLLRRPPLKPFSDPRTQRVLDLLADGPKRMAWLLKQAGARTPVQVDAGLLARQDIIARAGLTPTDLLHISGEYSPWDAELPLRVATVVARMWGVSLDEFIALVRRQMTRTITAEIVHFLSGRPVPESSYVYNSGTLANWLFDESLLPTDPFLGCHLQLKIPLVGIGAPARAFLPPVAEALGAEIIFPEYYQVANAVGTVVGNVLVRKEAEVQPVLNGSVRIGYQARAGSQEQVFERLDEALVFARRMVCEQAQQEAHAAGAANVSLEIKELAMLGEIYQLTASAVGKPVA